MAYVYWIKTKDITDTSDGYIGVTTKAPEVRLHQHHSIGRFCKYGRKEDLQQIVLFEGAVEECFRLEFELRPDTRIGWNIGAGGTGGKLGNHYVTQHGCPWIHKVNAARKLNFQTGKTVIHNRKTYTLQNIKSGETHVCHGCDAVSKLIEKTKPTTIKWLRGNKIRNCNFILI